uniref:Immunoglobulin like and fibronectin type III domain containing 1, tandem duplicate 3 n=1 Tax=Takifugu rubripes TaxID=31033 RepID=A0A3B5KHZ4_TAKRU
MTVRIKKRSKVPGVMITQYVEVIPEGMSTPDFTRKPISITIQEGKLVVFRAVVVGNPTPTVTWLRNNGEIGDERHKILYDKGSGEHQLQIPDVSADEADTYKCFATNEYGKAIVTATLNVIEVGYKKNKALQQSRTAVRETAEDFKKALKNKIDIDAKEENKMEADEKFFEVLMSAEKKDYESICIQYGVTDFRGMLKKLNEKKIEREKEQEKVLFPHPIEMRDDGGAEFELEMSLKDSSSKIYLFKDGVMIPFDADTDIKHGLKQVGKKYVFSINGVDPEDSGLYQVEVDGVKVFSTDFKDVKAEEREDAVFECVISQPLKKITWKGKNIPLEQGEKFDILVSEDMLIHTLVVKDCMPLDKGIYAAVAGLASCSAWLVVEDIEEDTNDDNDMDGEAGALVPDTVIGKMSAFEKSTSLCKTLHVLTHLNVSLVVSLDPGVYFTSGLCDVTAILGANAELVCKLSSEECDGVWYKDGKEICIVKDHNFRKLIIKNCKEEDAGKYRCEADGRKTEAMLKVEDPPRINPDDLKEFQKPVKIKTGKSATLKISFVGREPMKVQWYHEGEELLEDTNIKIEKSSTHTQLVLTKCRRKSSGEIKIKIKNECGTTEATTDIVVLDKPTQPLGPLDIIESSSTCIDFKWRVPKDNGGSPIIGYILERQQIGRNSWKKLGSVGTEPKYRDTDVDHGRKYCYHIRAETDQGISEMMETDDIQAGTKAFPGPPAAPKIVSAFKDCINLVWIAPSNTGGTNLLGYNVEKRKNGSNLWSFVNPPDEPIREKKYAVKDVVEGIEYEFRVSAINISGSGEPSPPSEFVFARDPKKPPGKVIDLRVTDSTYTTLSLGWTKPKEEEEVQDEAKGYFVEFRPAEDPEWSRCNSSAIIMNSYTIMGLKSMAMYWVRVVATNEGGDGEPQDLDNYIIAMPPPVKPTFTDRKIKNFMVVKAGNSARINFNFQACPIPSINWLKDGHSVAKHVTVSNTDTSSQLIIPSPEREDTGIYTIMVKNLVGQESSSVEIRVTDDPKPSGPVELEENVSGTVTISWTPSPDEKKDDRLHYMITKRDSVKRSWQTVADHLFNNKFTVVNIMPGRQYYFRIYAKNDMGVSKPSESQAWEVKKRKEIFSVQLPETKDCCFEMAPSFTVPLKMRNCPEYYECYMSCAVTGNPAPHITWYRNNVSLNTNTNYYITNTCGVCSMKILKVSSKDSGDYTVIAENSLGRAKCSARLAVNGKSKLK